MDFGYTLKNILTQTNFFLPTPNSLLKSVGKFPLGQGKNREGKFGLSFDFLEKQVQVQKCKRPLFRGDLDFPSPK